MLALLNQLSNETKIPTTADDPWPSLLLSITNFDRNIRVGMPQYADFQRVHRLGAQGFTEWRSNKCCRAVRYLRFCAKLARIVFT